MPESAITENGEQTPPLEPELFPLAGNGCPEPGVPVGGEREVREGFPTYYTVSWCGEDEIRVCHSLDREQEEKADGAGEERPREEKERGLM